LVVAFVKKEITGPFLFSKHHEATKQIDIVNSKVKIEPIKLAGLMITYTTLLQEYALGKE
jgi:hypothetical protein